MESLQLSELETIFNANKDFSSSSAIASTTTASSSLPQVVLDATAVVHEEKYPGEGCVLPPPVVNFVEPLNAAGDESDLTSSYYSDDSCSASLSISHSQHPQSQQMPEFSQLTSPDADIASSSSHNTFQWPPFNTTSSNNSNKVTIKNEDYDMPPCQHSSTHYGTAVTTSSEVSSFPFVTSPSTSIPSPSSTIYSASSPGTPGASGAPSRGRRPHGSTAPYSTKSSRRRQVEKGTVEYVEKRARNNVAVRKSRAKAKERQRETESRVTALQNQNDQLQKKVDLLSKELTVLKGLFLNVGATIPDEFLSLIEDS